MKRLISAILTIVLLFSCAAVPAFAEQRGSPVKRDTILLLDVSGSMSGTPIAKMKQAAEKFCHQLLETSDDNRIALILWSSSFQVYNFTSDIDSVIQKINGAYANGQTYTVTALSKARELMTNSGREDAIKNIVLLTDGLPVSGPSSSYGPYVSSDYSFYACANAAYNEAKSFPEDYHLYTFGFFHSLYGSELAFAQRFLNDLQNSGYYEVTDPENLEFVFGQVAEDLKDADGDGLLDSWEIEGVTIDGEFVDLPAMGADPNVPDVFVEIDWMVKPASCFLWIELRPETSLAPSENALRMVYDTFAAHGIRLHIDAGPDSTDFVTGQKWGDLSGANTIPYEPHFAVNDDDHAHWEETAAEYFSAARSSIFKYCLFVDQYDYSTSSGIANDIPGQYFIVASQEWVRKSGDTGIAGTFMHELGHTLGLCHGGHIDTGEGSHTNYKPNYLSVMNYLFQMSGLVGTNELNYSEYDLPDLDEAALDENAGIDPEGLTAGTGLGTKIKGASVADLVVQPIAGAAVDYDGNGVDSNLVTRDINADGEIGMLTSSNDWEHIAYKGGNLGKEYAYIAGLSNPGEADPEWLTEPMFEELVEAGVLGNKGAGSVSSNGPVTLISGVPGQNIRLRVNNLAPEETTFLLRVESNDIADAFSEEIVVPAAVDDIGFVDVKVPLAENPAEGAYTFEVSLYYQEEPVFGDAFLYSVYAPSEDEIEELANALDSGELADLLPQDVIDEYGEILEAVPCSHSSSHTEYLEPTCTEPGYDRTVCDKCGSVLSEEIIPALDHMLEYDIDVEPTCIEPGRTGGAYCLRCDYRIEPETVAALGHDWDEGAVTVPATATEPGVKTFTCLRCGEQRTEDIPAAGYDPAAVFTDVGYGDWYYEAVDFALNNGLFNGMSEDTFGPNEPMTRAMLVTVLWRYEGSPAAGANTFSDVPGGQWYTDAVAWAAAKGIVTGIGNNRFHPNGNITREQMATILFRYAQMKGNNTDVRGDLFAFPDHRRVSAYATDAIRWAVGEGIIGGSDGRLLPQGNATRAQVAAILMRYIRKTVG